jgi:hypothetical protein
MEEAAAADCAAFVVSTAAASRPYNVLCVVTAVERNICHFRKHNKDKRRENNMEHHHEAASLNSSSSRISPNILTRN